MNDKKCQKCGVEELGWNPQDHDSTGRWRLWDYENNVAHEEKCEKRDQQKKSFSGQRFTSPARFKANMYEKCPYCDGYFLKTEGIESHVETYHKDKVVHRGTYVAGDKSGLQWEDEIWPSKYSEE